MPTVHFIFCKNIFSPALNIAFLIVFLFFSHKEQLRKVLFCTAVYFLLVFFCEIPVKYLFQYFSQWTTDEIQNNFFQKVVMLACLYTFLSTGIFAVTAVLQKNLVKIKRREILLLLAIPLSEVVMLFGVYASTLFFQIPVMYLIAAIASVGAIVATYLLFFVIKEVAHNTELEIKTQYLEQQQQIQMQYYSDINDRIMQTKQLRHDISNHLQTMRALLNQGDYQKASDYFQTVEAELSNNSTVFYCDHPALNALLCVKSEHAQSQKIETEISVTVSQSVEIREIDLISLFSNLFDNAIEACEHAAPEHTFVRISDHAGEGCYTLKITNSKLNTPVPQKNRKFISSKPDSNLHGLGLEIVQGIAQKYDGTALFHDNGAEFEAI
ncbi:MAG: GHKL domain-containing protein, partial [Pygmaiobacter sp.]